MLIIDQITKITFVSLAMCIKLLYNDETLLNMLNCPLFILKQLLWYSKYFMVCAFILMKYDRNSYPFNMLNTYYYILLPTWQSY